MAQTSLKRKTQWKQDPDAVREAILQAATSEFAANGLSGGRIDAIAAQTSTSKRMIYYYFTDKEGLYLKVLEGVYARVRQGEDALDLEKLDPATAMRRIIEFTFDYHHDNPDFVRIIMIENIHNAEYAKRSSRLRKLNLSAIKVLEGVLQRGQSEGIFRTDVSALQLHFMISAISFYNVSNRASFSFNFGNSLQTKKGQAALREQVVKTILDGLAADIA